MRAALDDVAGTFGDWLGGDDGGIELDLGDTGVGVGMPSAESFRGRPLLVLGPGAMQNMDLERHVPLFGLVARSVTRVELTYAAGPPLRVDDVDGAFVLLAEPECAPQAVLAFDAAGREVARERVDEGEHAGARVDWSRFGPPAPVVPTRCQPGVVGTMPPAGCPNG